MPRTSRSNETLPAGITRRPPRQPARFLVVEEFINQDNGARYSQRLCVEQRPMDREQLKYLEPSHCDADGNVWYRPLSRLAGDRRCTVVEIKGWGIFCEVIANATVPDAIETPCTHCGQYVCTMIQPVGEIS